MAQDEAKTPEPVDKTFTDTVPDAFRVSDAQDTDDTDELPVLVVESAREIRKYAKSFLRFYRTRRILSGNRNIQTVTRERALYAWQYLASLAPEDLPPGLREPYREIFALAQRLDHENHGQSLIKFVSEILKITITIDEMVDGLLTETEKPSS